MTAVGAEAVKRQVDRAVIRGTIESKTAAARREKWSGVVRATVIAAAPAKWTAIANQGASGTFSRLGVGGTIDVATTTGMMTIGMMTIIEIAIVGTAEAAARRFAAVEPDIPSSAVHGAATKVSV